MDPVATKGGPPRHTNRLIDETSPYLRQHAHNPVDWLPWGPEALELSRRLDKPIFLSIGYSACHWCHVMERESFEDPATAAVMNEHFVNIKVDREERPDLDQIYMSAVQMMTQHGGWPMSVWLTPDLKPFYSGTYFPPASRYNMPAFCDLLAGLAQAWNSRRAEIDRVSNDVSGRLHEVGQVERRDGDLTLQLFTNAAAQFARIVDRTYGGIGRAPKFPHSVEMRLLLQGGSLAGSKEYRELALLSLEKMICGGIYDQLGGGFHRYSTDQRWLAPHFEKMLYDNALIAIACLEAYQASGKSVFGRAASETMEYILREMTAPEGPFFSTQDADSEGEEGKFFVWSHAEILSLLGDEPGRLFCDCYDVSPAGNWEGKNILNLPTPLEGLAGRLKINGSELESALAEGRRLLFNVRERRIKPGRDEKILTAWNGMMIDAMACAAQVLDEPRYSAAAARAADFILTRMRTPDGKLLRTSRDGRAKLNGYLEDYSYLANGLVSLYEADFNPRWLVEAQALAERMIEQFWDDRDAGFFFTGKDHETLITRTKDPNDGAIPSGNSMAATALVRLGLLTGREDFQEKAEQTLRLFRGLMAENPLVAGQMLLALRLHLGPTVEAAVVGDPVDNETRRILRTIHAKHLPNKVVALSSPAELSTVGAQVPLLAGKTAAAGPTVYLCRRFACQAPIHGADAFAKAWSELAT